MILKNIIQNADPDTIADIWNTWRAEYEKPYDKEKLKTALQNLIKVLTWTEQKSGETPYVFIATNRTEDGTTNLDVAMCKKSDIETCIRNIKGMDPLQLTEEEPIGKQYERIQNYVPQSYGYEFTPWAEILATEVFMENLKAHGLQNCLADILHEMTFCGWTEERRSAEREELDQAAEEVERIMKLPEEEQKQYMHSLDDVMEGLGIERKETEQEEKDRVRNMKIEMLQNANDMLNELKRIQDYILEEK